MAAFRQFQRRMVGLSFGLGTLALTWYASMMYRSKQSNHQHGNSLPPQPLWEASSIAVYILGISCWILTGALIYLSPLWGKNRTQGHASNDSTSIQATSHTHHAGSDRSRRLIFWCLVVAPSLWVYAYGTSVEILKSKAQILGDDHLDAQPSLLEWIEILLLASALPSGTAGMMSMGIYVFGTVAKHSPLWSAYALLPNGAKHNHSHANLMKDALRLHQWAGYVTFAWFLFHAVLYCVIYGLAGLKSAAANTTMANATTTVASHALMPFRNTSSSTTKIFFGAMWHALVPPPQCRPILNWWGTNHNKAEHENQNENQTQSNFDFDSNFTNSTNPNRHNSTSSHHHEHGFPKQTNSNSNHQHHQQTNSTNSTDPNRLQHKEGNQCYGYYRNFNGFLAILAILMLVLTSLTVVRRKSYRFFYVSHILTAILFLITMILHMKRIIVYLLPSLVLYLATTIPSWIECVVAAILDRGVQLHDITVLGASGDTTEMDDTHGVAEMTFWVETDCGDALVQPETMISHRPKSVRICVPSISWIWYPFTVIEVPCTDAVPAEHSTNTQRNLVKYKILFGTVGYFTKTLWKRLAELEQFGNGNNVIEPEDLFNDEEGESPETMRRNHAAREHHRRFLPLLLVDGFYTGSADWIENARNHDCVLVAAGGTGVTPFLTFLPKLLHLLRAEGDAGTTPSISFLWCCRDEAFIQHVVMTYLLPLFSSTNLHGESSGEQSRVRLMIHNTSRDRHDTTPLELEPNRNLRHKQPVFPTGAPMKPSRLQHHPYSSQTRVLVGTISFLAISVMGVGIHFWANNLILSNPHVFSVRLYGLFAIVAWTCLVGFLTETICRFGSSKGLCHAWREYSIPNNEDEHASFQTVTIESTVSERDWRNTAVSLSPGSVYSELKSDSPAGRLPAVQLVLCNGRPIIEARNDDDDDNESGEHSLRPFQESLEKLVGAHRPGVFFCGPQSLMEAIRHPIDTGRSTRKHLAETNSIVDCVYYEESFEM